MGKCDICGKKSRDYGMVILTDKYGNTNTMCEDCYNDHMAKEVKVVNDNNYNREISMADCEGIVHVFEIGKKISPMGILWTANEFVGDNEVAYTFEAFQDFEESSAVAIEKLYKKIRKGLSKKFLKKYKFENREFLSINGKVVEGRIEWDEENINMPKIIIDGKALSFEEFGEMLLSFEGHFFKLEMVDPSDYGE